MSGFNSGVSRIAAGTNITIGGTPTNPVINATGGGGGATIQAPKENVLYTFLTDSVFGPGTSTTLLLNANTVRAFRITIPKGYNLTPLVVNSPAATPITGAMKIGLYGSNSAGTPGALLFNLGEINITATGGVYEFLPTNIPAGEYWMVVFIGAGFTLRSTALSVGITGTMPLNRAGITNSIVLPPATRYDANLVFPATIPADLSATAFTPQQGMSNAYVFFQLN